MARRHIRYNDARVTDSDRWVNRRGMLHKIQWRRHHQPVLRHEGFVEESLRYYAVFAFCAALITLNPLIVRITRETSSVEMQCHSEWNDN